MGVGVGTKQPRTLKLLVRAEICCSEITSAITIAATNGLRNARGRWVVFKVGSSPIDERPGSSAGLAHDRKLCVKADAAAAPHLPSPDSVYLMRIYASLLMDHLARSPLEINAFNASGIIPVY